VIRVGRAREIASERLSAEVAAARQRWKPLVDEFTSAETRLKDLTIEHTRLDKERAERESIAAQEKLERATRVRQEAEQLARNAPTAQARAEAQLAIIEAVTQQREVLEQADSIVAVRAVSVPSGTVSVGEVYTYKITDENLLPERYTKRVPDKRALQAAVRAGVRAIPGVAIYPKPTARSRPKARQNALVAAQEPAGGNG